MSLPSLSELPVGRIKSGRGFRFEVVSIGDTQAMTLAFLESLGGMANAADLLAMNSGCKVESAVRQLKGWKAGDHRMRADTYDRLWTML